MKKLGSVIGILLTLLMIAAEGVFAMTVLKSGLLPEKYRIPAVAVLILLPVILAVLLWNMNHRIRFVIGLVLWFFVIAALIFGSFWIRNFSQKMSDIVETGAEIVKMSVYVRSDDPAENLENTKGYKYGVLQSLDRENTDRLVKELEEEDGISAETKEYTGIIQLVDGLRSGEVDAVIMNSAFMDVVSEMEGYETVPQELRLLAEKNLEYRVNAVTDADAASQTMDGGKEPELSDGMDADSAAEGHPETPAGSGSSVAASSQNGTGNESSSSEMPSSMNYGSDPEGVYTVYVSGIDSRDGMVARSRTDSNILITANMNTKQMLILSTPRDYYVPLSISGGAKDKLTHAGIYGIQVSMDTMEMLYRTRIPWYVRVNFEGFTRIIDMLGGITVYSDYEFDSKNILGYHFNQGENQMNGEEALVFARERFSFQEGDRQRGKNQMAVIKGVLAKLDTTDVLTDFSKYLDALEGSFETNITYDMITDVVQKVIGNTGEWELFTYSVNGTGGNEVPYSLTSPVYVMIPDEATVDQANALINKVKNGERLTEADVS